MTHAPDTRRLGASAPEAIVALLLGLFLVQLGFTTLARLRTVQEDLERRSDALVALRVARHVLREELRVARPVADWSVGADSLPLRAFRGTALVCPADSVAAALEVSYAGERAPDPAKDSVLLFTSTGAEAVRALVGGGATSPTCGTAPGSGATWSLDAPAPPRVVLARLFEHGSYHLSGSALRYRRGASGRQPLTPEVWSGATSWTLSGGTLRLDLVPRASGVGRPWSGFLAWADPP